MKEAKKERGLTSGSIKVNPNILSQVRRFCKEEGVLVSHFATVALMEKLSKDIKVK